MKKIIIGIAGISEVGKSTVANILSNELSLPQFALATPVKMACAAALNMPLESFLELDKNKTMGLYGKTVREFMQNMGDALQQHNPKYLIQHCALSIACSEIQHQTMRGHVISDVRKNSECEWVRSKGGTVVHVIQHNAPQHPHSTEVPPDFNPNTDYKINNTGSLESLHESALELARHLYSEA